MAEKDEIAQDKLPRWPALRQWRKFRTLTQEDLAEKVGMAASSISQLENGKQDFTGETLRKLAAVLDCSPGDLVDRSPFEEPPPWENWLQLSPDQQNEARLIIDALASARKQKTSV